MSGINMDVVLEAYVASREEIRKLTAQIDEIKAVQSKREDYLLTELQKLGAQNLRTVHGTVYITTKESVTVADWSAVLDYVRANEAWEFLTKGVSKSAVLEYLGEEKENPPPPGVSYVATRTVGIRRS